MLVGLLMLMFAGGLVGAETPLGGSLVFGGFVGTCCLGLVSPLLALVFFVRARVGPGLQAAALSGLIWALVALITWAGLRG